jgi:hypothetical protein
MMTFQQIADEMNISTSRVHQLYNSGMDKIRKQLASDPDRAEGLRLLLHPEPEEDPIIYDMLDELEQDEMDTDYAWYGIEEEELELE